MSNADPLGCNGPVADCLTLAGNAQGSRPECDELLNREVRSIHRAVLNLTNRHRRRITSPMQAVSLDPPPPAPTCPGEGEDEDHLALAAAARHGAALCTIVGIEGSFSRRLGAQLAILPDGSLIGSLADGCLEQQLKSDCSRTVSPIVERYGRGSHTIDFRLPCGGGLDILLDPAPDRAACMDALGKLAQRRQAQLVLPSNPHLAFRSYVPSLRVRAIGEGPELEAMEVIAAASGIDCEIVDKGKLSLGQRSELQAADRWTAVVLLFHDHEWETTLIEEALEGEAFYIGAQGGHNARNARIDELRRRGASAENLARIRSPIGTPIGSRTPQALALAVLAEITGEYERLRSAA